MSIFDVVEGWEATFLFWQQFSVSFFLPWSSISLQGEMVEIEIEWLQPSILVVRFSQEAAGERTVVQRNHITDLISRARRF